jgi:hypothetical protein
MTDESYSDYNTMDWILSKKEPRESDVDGMFASLLLDIHAGKSATGGLSTLSYMMR